MAAKSLIKPRAVIRIGGIMEAAFFLGKKQQVRVQVKLWVESESLHRFCVSLNCHVRGNGSIHTRGMDVFCWAKFCAVYCSRRNYGDLLPVKYVRGGIFNIGSWRRMSKLWFS